MKLMAHDAYHSFDWDAVVNIVFDLMVRNGLTMRDLSGRVGLSYQVVAAFFRYEQVSLPTLLKLAAWASVNLEYYIIDLD